MRIIVTADDELRVVTSDGTVAQKLVTGKTGLGGHDAWNMRELLEIASYLHDSPKLREHFERVVDALGWVLYHQPENPTRKDLTNVMRLLMTCWSMYCSQSEDCIAPPSRRMLSDHAMRKVLRAFQEKQDEEEEEEEEE